MLIEKNLANSGDRLRRARILAGIATRREFEIKYQISANTLQGWEQGKNPLSKKGAKRIIEALKAEGVRASVWDYPEQHKLKIYSESKWWHHAPKIPESMPGNAHVNANHIFVPLFHREASELIDQYVKAFEKVWARKSELAKV